MGYGGMVFNPSPQAQTMNLFDPSTIRASSRQPSTAGGTSIESTFASIMEHVSQNEDDDDEDDDDDPLSGAIALGMASMGFGMGGSPSMNNNNSVNVLPPSVPSSAAMTRENSTSNASVHSGHSSSGRDKMHLNTSIWVPSPPMSATTPKASRRKGSERDREHREHHREHRDHNNATGTSHSRSALTTGNSNASSSLSLMLAPSSASSSSSLALTLPAGRASASSASASSLSLTTTNVSNNAVAIANASISQDSFYAVAERARDERLRVRRGEFQSRSEVVAAFQRRVEDLMSEFAEALQRADDFERFGPPTRT